MHFPKRETVEEIRKLYPKGTCIVLLRMDDVQAPPVGTKGIVWGVDDAGNILMNWENGSWLNLVVGVDSFRVIE